MTPQADSTLPEDPAALMAMIAALRGELAEERTARRPHFFQRLPRSRARGRGADREAPAHDRRGGRDRAETDQDEEYALVEGEPHRL